MRIASMLLLPLAFSVSDARGREAGAKLARGVVFHDENANRKLDLDEKPLPGVKVSNGHEIVTTGEAGRYELRVSDDTILFVIKIIIIVWTQVFGDVIFNWFSTIQHFECILTPV